ncbi:unnamed protein product, partial [Ascophyllum nodosum]
RSTLFRAVCLSPLRERGQPRNTRTAWRPSRELVTQVRASSSSLR